MTTKAWQVRQGDALEVLRTLPSESVHCCVTSPPYWGLRDYGVSGQLGLEKTPEEYVAKMTEVFREVRRVLRSDGTLWLNIGDSYAGSGCGWRGDEDAKRYASRSFQDQEATKAFSRSKRIERGSGRWGGGNNPATGDVKPKDLCGIPWLLAFSLRADGWYLRQDIIWSKPNPMPESVTDRCTKAHEYLFLLSKSGRYFYDAAAIKEDCVAGNNGSSFTSEYDVETKPNLGQGTRKVIKPRGWASGSDHTAIGWATQQAQGSSEVEYADIATNRNKRSVWEIATSPFPEAHFATFPPKLIEPCILAGSPEGGTVLDPFSGAGTTGLVATRFARNYIGIELNPAYVEMSEERIGQDAPLFNLAVDVGSPSPR